MLSTYVIVYIYFFLLLGFLPLVAIVSVMIVKHVSVKLISRIYIGIMRLRFQDASFTMYRVAITVRNDAPLTALPPFPYFFYQVQLWSIL